MSSMSWIIRLQNLALSAISIDIRTFFHGLSIPDGGVHIVGGPEGDAFIAFSTDEDARQAMQLNGQKLKDTPVRLLLSSRTEMFKVIEQARIAAGQPSDPPSTSNQHDSGPVGPDSLISATLLPLAHTSQGEINGRNRGGFSNQTPANLLGTGIIGGLGLGAMTGSNTSGFLPQHQNGLNMEALGANKPSFPGPFPNTSNNGLGSQDRNSGNSNQNLFGMAASMAGMNLPFSSMMSNGGNMPNMNMNINPAAMIAMGIPPGMLPPPTSNSFQGPRMLMNNPLNGSSNNGPPMPFSHPVLGLMGTPPPRPTGGFPAGLNPNFMAGGSGLNAGKMGGPNINLKDGNSGMIGNGSFRQGSNISGRPESIRDSRDRGSRSNSRERREITRRRRSRSRERERPERRRRFSRSKSRSRSPKSRLPSRRDSRDKEDRRRGEISPEKGRGRRDSDPIPTPFNTTEEQHPAIKLIGVPKDTSYREIKEFLRVDIMGGGDGVVRLYEEGVAYVKIEKPSDFPRAYRSNGRKLRNSLVNMEGIIIERWVNEYKMNKSKMERDVDRDRERDRMKDRDERGSDRERPERPSRPRFNSAAQSSCIVIRNLPPTITNRDVSSRLLKDAPVTDMIVAAGPVSNGRHTAMAYVKLESSQSAQKVIDLVVRSQEGANLVVEVCNEEEFNNARNRTPGGLQRLEQRERDPKSQGDNATSIFDLDSGLDDESCSIMIKGAPPNVSERDVFDFFSDIGLVPLNVKVMYDAQGTCNGQIICEFPDSHKARRATTKDGMLLGRGHVQVEMLPSGRRRSEDPSSNKGPPRPSLLGARPIGPGAISPRFGIPPGPNPFVQALQIANGPRHSTSRGRGAPSRFSSRSDYGNSNDRDTDDRIGGSRGRGSGAPHVFEKETVIGGPDLFGKPGCVLALENVPYKASMDDILHHLSSILKLDIARERIIRRFDDTEKPTGDARVAFDTPAEAKLACDRLDGTKMWNRLISYTIL